MFSYFYNAETRPKYKKARITNARISRKSESLGKTIYATKEEVLSLNLQGQVWWYEENRLYTGYLDPEEVFIPIGDRPIHLMGTSCAMVFFKYKKDAEEFKEKCTFNHTKVMYDFKADIYIINYFFN